MRALAGKKSLQDNSGPDLIVNFRALTLLSIHENARSVGGACDSVKVDVRGSSRRVIVPRVTYTGTPVTK